jgi:integrase/recombinase XerD
MSRRQDAATGRCTPFNAWPAVDQAAWTAAQRKGDPFKPGGLASTWATDTVTVTENGYGRWLAWLDTEGLLVVGQTPASRVTRDRMPAYAAALAALNAPLTVMSRVRQLGNALRAMAPTEDWRWMLRAADRMRAVAKHTKDKRARMVPPDELEALGIAIMDKADADATETDVRRAGDYRDGLLIATLARRPFRIKNITMIACGRHLVRQGDGWLLTFTAAETKENRPMEAPYPEDLRHRLERYLEVYRPTLLDVGVRTGRAPTNALWISAHGRAASTATIRYQITDRTKAAFGTSLNPHGFRDSVATWIAIHAPEDAPIIAKILGHATLAVAERHYNLAQSLEAGRRLHGVIRRHRKAGTTTRATR